MQALLSKPRVVFGLRRDGFMVPLAMMMTRLPDSIGFTVQALPTKEGIVMFGATSTTVVGMTEQAATFFNVRACHGHCHDGARCGRPVADVLVNWSPVVPSASSITAHNALSWVAWRV